MIPQPAEARNPLAWHRVDPYHEISDCGHYTVTAARASSEWRFTGWYCDPPRTKYTTPKLEILGTCRDVTAARDLCVQHQTRQQLAPGGAQ